MQCAVFSFSRRERRVSLSPGVRSPSHGDSRVFLGKIAQQLARAGILEIMQGARELPPLEVSGGGNASGGGRGCGRRDLLERLFTQTRSCSRLRAVRFTRSGSGEDTAPGDAGAGNFRPVSERGELRGSRARPATEEC